MPVLKTASPPMVPFAPTLRPQSTVPSAKAMRAEVTAVGMEGSQARGWVKKLADATKAPQADKHR